MKNTSKLFPFMAVSAIAAVILVAGCEVDSADSRVHISPGSATLRKNQSVVLSAHKGYRCTWSLETEEWGTLSPRTGAEVVYTSLYEPLGETPVVQVVTVISTFEDAQSADGTTTTGTVTAYVSSAEAYITHLPVSN